MVSAVAIPLISAAVGSLLCQGFGIANVAMVYVLGVAVFAIRSSRLESVICTVLNVLSFNFFFVESRYTFAGPERDELACWWEHSFDGPLLVVRSPANQRYSDALALIKSMPNSAPLAILTHRPRSESRRWGRRTEFDTFVREAELARSDVQVHIYSSTWRMAPPRVR